MLPRFGERKQEQSSKNKRSRFVLARNRISRARDERKISEFRAKNVSGNNSHVKFRKNKEVISREISDDSEVVLCRMRTGKRISPFLEHPGKIMLRRSKKIPGSHSVGSHPIYYRGSACGP